MGVTLSVRSLGAAVAATMVVAGALVAVDAVGVGAVAEPQVSIGVGPCTTAAVGDGHVPTNGIAVFGDGYNRVHQMICDSNGMLSERLWTAGYGWSAPVERGDGGTSDVDGTTLFDGSRFVFFRGVDGALWGQEDGGGGPQPEFSLGGGLSAPPGATSQHVGGQVDVVVAGNDGGVWHRVVLSGLPWESLGGGVAPGSMPDAAWLDNDTFEVFIHGLDNALWTRTWRRNIGWDDWTSLGGRLITGVTAAVDGSGRLDVISVGEDAGVWARSHTPTTGWTGWYPLGGLSTSTPHAEFIAGTVYVSIRGIDGNVWGNARTSSWIGWYDGGSFS